MHNYFRTSQSTSFTFFAEHLIVEGQCEVAVSETSHPMRYQNVTEGEFKFQEKTSKVFRVILSGTHSLPFNYGFCWSNEHSQWREVKASESCITVEKFPRTQKIEIRLANGQSRPAFFGTHLGHAFKQSKFL